MKQTPIHDTHNSDLLPFIPSHSMHVIEIGCSSGALAREFKMINPTCQYLGIDIEPSYVELAKRFCDQVEVVDIENQGENFYSRHTNKDCWVFADTLEHLRDPWRILREIRKVIPAHGTIVASIPNVQHWSVFAKLSVGNFRYVDSGIFDRTHLRWFTRQTINEMFNQCGFSIVQGGPRIFDEPDREKFLPLIGEMARTCGANANEAMNDAMAYQFILRAVPA
jgi:ubiquinone/menaquinone biosynthesis C-methylase UbiE